MAPSKYQQRIPTILAERLDTTKPVEQWPAGVHDGGDSPGLHFHMPDPLPPAPIKTGDWILHDAVTTAPVGALSDAEFHAQYEIAIGPTA